MPTRPAYYRWRELHEAQFPPHPEDVADPDPQHDPLCVWSEQPLLGRCFGCELVALRSDATYEKGEIRSAARETLHELLDMVRGHMIDAEEFGP